MNRTAIHHAIEQDLTHQHGKGVRIYGTETFADGYLVKFYREYVGLHGVRRSEDRVAFFVPYTNDVGCLWNMIARTD